MRKDFINYNNEFVTILYVQDQGYAKEFYKELSGVEPTVDVPGLTEFSLNQQIKLGLMPELGIYKILKDKVKDPRDGTGIPRCELCLFVEDPGYYYQKTIELGGIGVSEGTERNWGDSVAYCSDKDGHIIAFAKKK
jgi:hypothetical protein